MKDYRSVPGILLFYEHHLQPNANTIFEHLDAFSRYCRLPVYACNLALGLPPALSALEFSVAVFHYTLMPNCWWLTSQMHQFLRTRPRMYKVALFQDEIWYFAERLDFLKRCQIQCLYSRHKPQYWDYIYGDAHSLQKRIYYLPGYVSASCVQSAHELQQPLECRLIDVAYRGNRQPYYLGRASQEKARIGERFLQLAAGAGLQLDIAVDEKHRLYGQRWHELLAASRTVLGVEGGVSVIDLSDSFRREYEALIRVRPDLTFEEFAELMGERFAALEDRVYYRSISPRHFEAATFRNVQILFEGRYDDILVPGVHYIPLRKDFGNFAEVMAQVRNLDHLRAMAERTWADLIGSGRYSYESFIRSFDNELLVAGVRFDKPDPAIDRHLRAYLEDWNAIRERCYHVGGAIQRAYAGRPRLRRFLAAAKTRLDLYERDVLACSVQDYLPNVQQAVRTQDNRFWQKLNRVARCDLGVGTPPSGAQLCVDYLTDPLAIAWRRLRRLLRRNEAVEN